MSNFEHCDSKNIQKRENHQDRCDEVLAPALTAMAVKTARLSLLLVRDAMEQVQGLAKGDKEALRILISKTWTRFVTKKQVHQKQERSSRRT
eukprot:4351783-Amphidinium_carterae.1